jgi:hypothetical protein
MSDEWADEAPAARYVRSGKNITGCILAVGGPVLIFTGVVAVPVGIALTPVLYAIGALAAPPRRRVDVVAGLDKNDVRKSLDEIQQKIMARDPGRIGTKVNAIARTIKEILPRADTLGAGSPGHYVLYMCATDYLPTAIQAYLDLPRHYADTHVVADGKTSLDLLADQLDLLEKEINEIAANVNRADTDRLVANGRFLEEKFGSHPLDPEREQGA